MWKLPRIFSKPTTPLWRQGDVFIIALPKPPTGARVDRRPVLAEGEATGHAHRLQDPASAQVFSVGAGLYLQVLANSATVVHDEHQPVTIPRGNYEVRIQREYSPQAIRRVVD